MTKKRFSTIRALLLLTVLTAGCVTPAPREDLEYGRALMASGRVREAVSVLGRLHEARPADVETAAAYRSAREQLAIMDGQRPPAAAVQASSVAASRSAASAPSAPAAAASPAPVASSASSAAMPVVTPLVAPAPVVSSPAPAAASRSQAASSAQSAAPRQARVVAAASSVPAPRSPQPVPQAAAVSPSINEALDKKVTLQFRDAPVRSLFDAIGKSSGLNLVIDPDVQQELQTSIYLRDTTVRNALEKVVLTTRLAWRILDDNTLLIYPDEPTRQADYQQLVVRGFHLANADVKLVANSLKTILRFNNVVVDEKLNMIVVRDTPRAIALAEQLIALHDVAEPEVMLEVAILEVSTGRLQNLGVAWPTSATLSPLPRTVTTSSTSGTTTTTSSSLTVRDLFNLTPGSTLLNMGGLTLNAGASDTDVNILASPRIRAKNREKARILIGERVPNISATATSNGVVSQNITYVDVGLKLEVEPQIFPGNEIGLKISLEVSSINEKLENTANGNVAYRIGTRNTSTVLRLKDGENQVLAGLIQDSDRKTISKVPLLGDIPILGRLFRSDSTDKGKTEVVLSITPRLVRGIVKPEAGAESFDAGTVTGVRGRRNEVDVVPEPAQPQPEQQPAGNRRQRDED